MQSKTNEKNPKAFGCDTYLKQSWRRISKGWNQRIFQVKKFIKSLVQGTSSRLKLKNRRKKNLTYKNFSWHVLESTQTWSKLTQIENDKNIIIWNRKLKHRAEGQVDSSSLSWSYRKKIEKHVFGKSGSKPNPSRFEPNLSWLEFQQLVLQKFYNCTEMLLMALFQIPMAKNDFLRFQTVVYYLQQLFEVIRQEN